MADNYLPRTPEVQSVFKPAGRSRKQWLFLLAVILIACLTVLAVLKQIKPVALQNQASQAAPVLNVSWTLLEPENTVSSKIYRTTSTFLSDPAESALVATVAAPTATYSDTAVTSGTLYYYSIFAVDTNGEFFDPYYIRLQAPTETSSGGSGGGSTGGSKGGSGGSSGGGSSSSGTGSSTSGSSSSGSGTTSIQIPSGGTVNLPETTNFLCTGDPTVHVYYKGQKESYPSAEVFFLWNTSFAGITTISQEQCGTIPTRGLVRVPDNTLVKAAGGATVYLIVGTTARPIASLGALYKISSAPKIIPISLDYLRNFSGGEPIY